MTFTAIRVHQEAAAVLAQFDTDCFFFFLSFFCEKDYAMAVLWHYALALKYSIWQTVVDW